MSEVVTEIIMLFALITINGLFSMTETAVVSSRRARLQTLLEDGDQRAKTVLELLDNPNDFFSTIQIAITLIGVITGAIGAQTFSPYLVDVLVKVSFLKGIAQPLSVLLISGLITYFSLVIGELIPKRIATNNPEKIAMTMCGPVKVLSKIFRPVVRILSVSTEAGLKLIGVKEVEEAAVSEDEIKVMIEQGKQDGVFEENEQDIVESVFRLSDQTVDALMTPRTELDWIDLEEPVEESLKEIADSTYHYFPLVRGNPDNVLGVISSKALLDAYIRRDEIDLEKIAEPPLFVPESKPALSLLDDLKASESNFAVVLDEYGGFSGMITPYDLLNELVGDVTNIGEEPDEVDDVLVRGDGAWSFDGMIDIEKFKETIDVKELPDEDRIGYQTLAGFILSQTGSIPSAGFCFDWNGFHFEIVDMDGLRIDRVFVNRIEVPEEETLKETETNETQEDKSE
ncbi:MAG: HlyC/CorC family transporter [Anaerolineaceae bacterium]|nr:HlyC/CorC family transporter [Anaerolineaceae bacterium]